MSHADERDGGDDAGAGRFPGAGPVLGLFGLYVATVLGGVLLASPFEAAGVPTLEHPRRVTNVVVIFAEILVFTLVFVAIVRYEVGERALRALIVTVFGYVTYLAVTGAFPTVARIQVVGLASGATLWLALWFHPEWYVIDAAAVLAGAAIIAQLGNSLGPLPVVVFLAGMAVYDAYSVYVSEHMQQVGGAVSELRLPMVYVVPQSLSFSMADMGDPFDESGEPQTAEPTNGEGQEGEGAEEETTEEVTPEDGTFEEETKQRETEGQTPLLLGLGDAIVPGLLAVSGGQFLDAPSLVAGTVLNAPALGAILGSIVGLGGLLVLLYVVERAHAGLPVLNTCVFLGYLSGAAAAGIPVTTALGL